MRISMAKFKIRQATLRDLDVLVLQRHNMWEDIIHPTAKEQRVADLAYKRWARKMMKSKSLTGFIVSNGSGKVVAGGCVWLQKNQPMPRYPSGVRPYLLSMYTDPAYRGKGLASMVVKEAMHWCKNKGYTRMWLHASEMGRSVYRKLGWKRTWEMRVDLGK